MTDQNSSIQDRLKKADQLRLAGSYDQALVLLEEIIRDNPFFAPAKLSLGRVFFESGNLESARVALEEFAEFVPDHPLANKILSKIYFHFSKHTKALEKIQQVLDHAPTDTVAKKLFDQIQEQSDERRQDDEDTKKNTITNRTATIAEIYRSQGHLKEALDIYKELQSKNSQPDYKLKIEQIQSQMDDRFSPSGANIEDEAATMETAEYHPDSFSPTVETESFEEEKKPEPKMQVRPPEQPVAAFQEEPTLDEPVEFTPGQEESELEHIPTFEPERATPPVDMKPTRKQKLERLLHIVQLYRGNENV